jgi:hypothetical protein
MRMNKKILSTGISLMILSVAILGVIPIPQAHAASNANLFVSAENSQWNNYFAGPQVIQVVVSDPDINRLDVAYGEPVVTINGKRLHMAQAIDGNWYAYFADSKQAQIADSTQSDTGKGLDFGRFCSPTSAITATGIDFSETKGIAISESAPGSSNGVEFPSTVISSTCTGATNGGINSTVTGNPLLNHVVRENKTLNPSGQGGVTKVGQITTNNVALERAWPIIQLYDFSAIPSTVVIDYQKSGSDQIVNLTFDRIPTNLISANLDAAGYTIFSQVHVTMNDPQLNIDPTEEDSWTWGTSTTNNTVYYQAFDRYGIPDADGTSSMQNLLGNLTSFMFNHNGRLTINPVASGPWVVNFTNNKLQALDDSESTQSIRGIDGPITFVESGGAATGVFKNSDSANTSDLVVSVDAPHGSIANLKYNDVTKDIVVGFGFAVPKQIILGNLLLVKLLINQDRNMDAADKLLDTSQIVQANIADPEKTKLLAMINNAMYSNMLSATPGGIHDYPLQCQSHEIKATVTPSPVGQLAFSYSSATGIYAPNITVNQTENERCLPYLIRGANLTSAVFDENAKTLTLNIVTPYSSGKITTNKAQIILSIDRSLLDLKDNNGKDLQFTSLADGIQQGHRENNTATTRLLTIPIPNNSSKIVISSKSPGLVANAGPDQVVRPGTTVTLDGSASTGQGIIYSWKQVSGEPVTIVNRNTATPTFIAPQVILGQQKILTFELTINQAGQAYTDTVQVTVRPLTTSPITVFTDKQLYTIGDIIQIYGSVNPTSSGVPVTLKIISQSNNIVTAGQVSVSKNGDYTFQVRSGGLVQPGTFTVMVQYGDSKITASTTFIVASSTGAPLKPLFSQDGKTVVTLSTSYVTKDQPLTIALKFANSAGVNIQHQNYEIKLIQDGKEVFSQIAIHTNTGEDTVVTSPLPTSDPVDIEIKLKGVGLPTDQSNWTGTKDEILIAAQIVPEFGPISFMILIVSFASIVLVLRFNKRIQI